MSLSTLDYLNLSAVAYLDFDKLSIGKNIAQLIGDKVIPEKDLNKPELSALQDPSNSRQILSDTNFKAVINFRSTLIDMRCLWWPVSDQKPEPPIIAILTCLCFITPSFCSDISIDVFCGFLNRHVACVYDF